MGVGHAGKSLSHVDNYYQIKSVTQNDRVRSPGVEGKNEDKGSEFKRLTGEDKCPYMPGCGKPKAPEAP